LGLDLVQRLGGEHELLAVDIDQLDVCDREKVRGTVTGWRPDIVIHCAAWTDVDGCEREPERAYRVNAWGTWHVAEACREAGASLLYVSTDYIFDGTKGKPYVETDRPNPVNVYGASKLAGEVHVRTIVSRHYIARSAWLYRIPSPTRNFVKAMLERAHTQKQVEVVSDQWGNPTWTRDLASALARHVVGSARPGIYHMTNAGSCTRAELAREIFRLAGMDIRVVEISSDKWPSAARRPGDTSLRTRRAGLVMRPWREALRECLSKAGIRGAGQPEAR
jgi:dTDP-4-dehydrorhamnose reductase